MGESLKRWERYDEVLQNDPGEKEYWYKPEIAVRQKGWAKMYVPKLWEDELGEINGNVWFRTTVTLPESASGQQALLSLPAVDDADVTYLNGQQIGTTNGYNRARPLHNSGRSAPRRGEPHSHPGVRPCSGQVVSGAMPQSCTSKSAANVTDWPANGNTNLRQRQRCTASRWTPRIRTISPHCSTTA